MTGKRTGKSPRQYGLQAMCWTVAGCAVLFAILKYTGFQVVAIGLSAAFGAATGNGLAWLLWKNRRRRGPTTNN